MQPPYPASCRPRAWAAASSVLVLQSALGLTAGVPAGTIAAPTLARVYGPLTVNGLQVDGDRLAITVPADGTAQVTAPEGLTVTTA